MRLRWSSYVWPLGHSDKVVAKGSAGGDNKPDRTELIRHVGHVGMTYGVGIVEERSSYSLALISLTFARVL
jgi:hypothetical protein